MNFLTTSTLIVPDGRTWQVSLKKEGKNVWFDDGWHGFVQYYSISVGHFLVFKYVKNSSFHVVIFDLTACEIDYPCIIEVANIDSDDDMDDGENVDIMEECVDVNEANGGRECDFYFSLEKMGIYISEKHDLLSAAEWKRVMVAARLLKPKNPSCLIILQPSKKLCRSVYFPSRFARRFISKDAKSTNVQVSNQAECCVEICWRNYGGFFLAKGWASISKDNNLKSGDICIFELMRKEDFLLKLHVFPA